MKESRTLRNEDTAAQPSAAESISLVRTLSAPPAVVQAAPAAPTAPQVKVRPAVRTPKTRSAKQTGRSHKPRPAARPATAKVPRAQTDSAPRNKPAASRAKSKTVASAKPGLLRRTWTRLIHAVKSHIQPAFRIASQRRLQLLEMQQLGDKRFLAVARVGEQTYLIGGGATSIVLLAELDRTVRPLSTPQELAPHRDLAMGAS